MEENLLNLEQICHDTTVAAGNALISIEDLGIAMFSDYLPTQYAAIRSVMELINLKAHTLASIRSNLLAEAERRLSRQNESKQYFSGIAGQFIDI